MKYEYLKRKMLIDNLNWFDSNTAAGKFQIPCIKKVQSVRIN